MTSCTRHITPRRGLRDGQRRNGCRLSKSSRKNGHPLPNRPGGPTLGGQAASTGSWWICLLIREITAGLDYIHVVLFGPNSRDMQIVGSFVTVTAFFP